MDKKDLEKLSLEAVEDYISSDESYDDDAQLRIDPATFTVDIADGEDAEDPADPRDYYDIMDLVEMNAEGRWIPEPEAIASVAAEYSGE